MRISDWSSDVCSSDLHQVTQADIDAGIVVNQAKVTGNDPDGNPTPEVPSDNPDTPQPTDPTVVDRKSVVSGKSVSVRVELGVRRMSKKKQHISKPSKNVRVKII